MRRHRRAGPVSAALVLAGWQIGMAHAADDASWAPAVAPPKLQAAETNAKQAIGADEIDGATVLEGAPALNWLDRRRDIVRDRYGIYFHGLYLGDGYADLDGGARRGASYSGRLDVELDIDLDKLAGISGGTLHANMFSIHGRDLSEYYIGNFLSINDIAAQPGTLLYELWYEQRFGDRLAVRVGQQGIDVEFLTSNYAGNFINATFGWPGLTSENLPDGGPAYPLAAPAVRVKFDPVRNLSILAAVFDGEPAGPCGDDPQDCDRSGGNFRVSDPPLVILEAQYRYNQAHSADALPGTLKIGAFEQFGRYAQQRFGTDGGSADIPVTLSQSGGFYAIIDQQVLRMAGDDPENGVGVFARIICAPSARSPVKFYADSGFSALGVIPGREDDLFGVAAAISTISRKAVLENESGGGIDAPTRAFEAVVEVTYQAQLIPGVALQPTFEYVVHPSGDIAGQANAVVFGVTTAIRF